MKTNTVLLSVDIYNELRDFKQKIEEEYSYSVTSGGWYQKIFVTTDQAVQEIAELNKKLQKENQDLKIRADIDEIKKMSYLEWRKWKKS